MTLPFGKRQAVPWRFIRAIRPSAKELPESLDGVAWTSGSFSMLSAVLQLLHLDAPGD